MRWLLSLLCLLPFVSTQNVFGPQADQVTWCTVSDMEHLKCTEFSEAVRASRAFSLQLKCKRAAFKDQCMNFLDNGQVNLVELDPGEVYTAGRYHSVIPIVSQRYGQGLEKGTYSVAVIHTNSNISSLHSLRGRSVCFSSVSDMAGWVVPMATLVQEGVLEISDCNNLVKSASSFFGPSCTPNSLIDKHNPTGDNPQRMCSLCAGRPGERCSGNDPYAGFAGAFKCLADRGDVAFLKHTTVDEQTLGGPEKYRYRLLCPFGGTMGVDEYQQCNWGFVPPNVIVTTSDTLPTTRQHYQDFLQKALRLFRTPSADYNGTWFGRPFVPDGYIPSHDGNDSVPWQSTTAEWWMTATEGPPRKKNATDTPTFFLLANGAHYQNRTNLLIQDLTAQFVPLLGNQQTFTGYLGDTVGLFAKLRKCPVPPAVLCVVSEKEMEKCHRMRTAFKSNMLKPDLNCIRGPSQLGCMHMIKEGLADLVVLEAGDIYRAGHRFGLVPIIAEQYNLDEPFYYVVAVTRQPDKETDLLYLKGKRSCHTGVNQAAGWIVPLSFLISNERMRGYPCDAARSAAEFFSKSCVPGALSREHGTSDRFHKNLCDLCHGTGQNFCARDAAEPFYGHTGAFRCLVEGGGEIAFVKHTTIFENTAGRNQMWWARNIMPTDFELLCRDGSRAAESNYANCNLGKVASNAMVTSASKPQQVIDAYIHLFIYAQQFYGSKYSEDFTFKMFVSEESHPDLIFQDSTQQLKPVPTNRRGYKEYLGRDFLQAIQLVDCSGATGLTATTVVLVVCWLAHMFH